MLRLSYAQACLTPSLARPVYLAGFGQNRVAAGVHDDLYVRALSLQDGSTQLVLAALDLLGLSRAHCQAIQKRVVGAGLAPAQPGLRTIVACTHTHHGPDTLGLWGRDDATRGVDEAYLGWLLDTVVETILAAAQGPQQPAPVLSAASTRVPGVVKNARDPHIVDDELTCLQFSGDDDQTLATLLIFPCHPETLWEHNPHITSDYVHSLRREVEAAKGAPCLFFAGALGGMLTPDVQDHSFAEAEALGATLARAALAALAQPECRLRTDAPDFALSTAQTEFAIPMRSPLLEQAIQAGLLADGRQPDGSLLTEANLIQVGPVCLLTVPGELLPTLGLSLKAQMRSAGAPVAGIIGLANDELGYILPREAYVYPDDPFKPGEHYEETMSVGPNAGPQLLEAVESLFKERLLNRP